jgi:sterol regulatory element-binding transcription factor 1
LQGDFAEASNHLRSCLQALGRPVPTSKFDLFACLCWNSLRQILHRLYIGKWMSTKAGVFWGVRQEDVKISARDAALVYHKLHQLHLTGNL